MSLAEQYSPAVRPEDAGRTHSLAKAIPPQGWHDLTIDWLLGDLGNFPAGRAVAFASLARPDLTQWHKITWNSWTACNWVYADIKSGLSRNARYWPPETAP
jgi:hypothetical protein